MKRSGFVVLAIMTSLFVTVGMARAQTKTAASPGAGQTTTAQQTPGNGGWFCPWCGASAGQYNGSAQGYRMGPGMMYGNGYNNMGPGMMRGCGYNNMGPGMMRGYGYNNMGPGMMYGNGYNNMGPGMMYGYQGQGAAQQYGQQGGKPLTEEQVKTLVENYVKNTGNPNLKVGKIAKENGKNYYVAEVTTKNGSLVDTIDVNEYTGWFRFANAG
jgi:hypothetical protein